MSFKVMDMNGSARCAAMNLIDTLLMTLVCGVGTFIFGWLLKRGLQTGVTQMKGERIDRETSPIMFWAVMAMCLMWVILLPSVAIAAWVHMLS